MPCPLLARLVTGTFLWLALPLPQDSHFNENGLEFFPDQNMSSVYPKSSTQLSISLLCLCPGVLYGCHILYLVLHWTVTGLILPQERKASGGLWLPDIDLNIHLKNSRFLRGESAGQSCGLRLTDPHFIPARQ